MLLSAFPFFAIFCMPRYVLPVLPFFYGLGAISLMSRARTPGRRRITAVAAVTMTVLSPARDPYHDRGEDNLRYLAVVGLHRTAARDAAARYADTRIVATWPVTLVRSTAWPVAFERRHGAHVVTTYTRPGS